MFRMVILTCLWSGGDCRQDYIQVDGVHSCAIHGQQYIQKWLVQRPWRVLKKWKCDSRQSAKV